MIGTPLFLNRQRASKYFEEIQPINWDTTNAGIPENANIVNNRLFGFHVGASYDLGLLKGKVFLTYTVNYGNLDPNTPFAPNMTQVYTLNEFSYEVPAYNLNLKVGLGIDFGELSGNVGACSVWSGEFRSAKTNRALRLFKDFTLRPGISRKGANEDTRVSRKACLP